jgi:hypothetical protein
MAKGSNDGYRSDNVGRQELNGPAITRIADACDKNVALKVNNEKWYAALLKNRLRLDRLHERLFD